MRLKGGKVLIDLTKYNIADDVSHHLSDEEIKAILDKGVSVKVFNGFNCVIDLIPKEMTNNEVVYQNISFVYDGGSHQFGVALKLESKVLSFVEL